MIPEFEGLNDSEVELMLKVPILICILIGGADGKIDKKEINEAIEMSSEQGSLGLTGQYISEVFQDFEDKVLVLQHSYPSDPNRRAREITEELTELNKVFPKLPRQFADRFYSMIRELALKIASSSGGILGMNAIDSAEAKFVNLSMIDPPSDVQ